MSNDQFWVIEWTMRVLILLGIWQVIDIVVWLHNAIGALTLHLTQ